ncbi:MAG: bifunctional phosphopantothenoylcysteine decarboxylase/phosphopantothenate--cysteine ligase CoaBC [Gemmatimonadota bacterium]
MRPYDDRRVLVVVAGSIAAYKSAYLVRRLAEAGAKVDVLLTRSAQRFIGKTTFEGLTGRPAHDDLWERPMLHLELGRRAEAAVVAPATAELLSRLARGAADELASATLLAAACPVLVCPAMNVRMWANPATQHNVALLRQFGHGVLGPVHGELAEGEIGLGRMVEPEEILAAVGRLLEPVGLLRGRKVVVTAGPTRAAVDPIRYLGNRSSGRMGFALADSAWRRGAEVTVIAGPGSAPAPYGPRVRRVESSEEMLGALREELEGAAVLLMAAAVGDYVPEKVEEEKIKKERAESLVLALRQGPDLLRETLDLRRRSGILTLAFALETEDALENGRRKLESKGVDFLAVNEARPPESGFETATNRVTLLDRWGAVEELPLLSKAEVADRLLDRLEEHLAE